MPKLTVLKYALVVSFNLYTIHKNRVKRQRIRNVLEKKNR
jgi:hypothetical protein